jgi:hypothetical protein
MYVRSSKGGDYELDYLLGRSRYILTNVMKFHKLVLVFCILRQVSQYQLRYYKMSITFPYRGSKQLKYALWRVRPTVWKIDIKISEELNVSSPGFKIRLEESDSMLFRNSDIRPPNYR